MGCFRKHTLLRFSRLGLGGESKTRAAGGFMMEYHFIESDDDMKISREEGSRIKQVPADLRKLETSQIKVSV
jgi:hypothetical protein